MERFCSSTLIAIVRIPSPFKLCAIKDQAAGAMPRPRYPASVTTPSRQTVLAGRSFQPPRAATVGMRFRNTQQQNTAR